MSTEPCNATLKEEFRLLRVAAGQREEELSRMVADAKSIFELNLRVEVDRLQKKYDGTLLDLDREIRGLKLTIEGRDQTIQDLNGKIDRFEELKLAALREQRQSVMLASEISNMDLAQSRSAQERQRYEAEKILKQRDTRISELLQEMSGFAQSDSVLRKAIVSRLVDAEQVDRATIVWAEGQGVSAFLDHVSLVIGSEARRRQHEETALSEAWAAITGIFSVDDDLPPLDEGTRSLIAAQPTLSSIIQAVSTMRSVHNRKFRAQIDKQADEMRNLELDCEGARLRLLTLEEGMSNFADEIGDKFALYDAALMRAGEMQGRLQSHISRYQAHRSATSAAVTDISQVYEADIHALQQRIGVLEGSLTSMVPRDVFCRVEQQLGDAEVALKTLKEDYDKLLQHSTQQGFAGSSRHDGGRSRRSSKAPRSDFSDGQDGSREGNPSTALISGDGSTDPFSRWGSEGQNGRPGVSTREHQDALDEISALRRELEAARSTIIDMKALVRRVRDRASTGGEVFEITARANGNGQGTESAVQPAHQIAAGTQGTIESEPLPTPHRQDGADGELQMQIFALRRERDAWKRKADAALAQASHAEEQRLASVHTYLQLVGRKEEEYAYKILAGETRDARNGSASVRRTTASAKAEKELLMPGGDSRGGLNSSALAGVMEDVRARGEQRAERWLADKASELRAQAHQLGRLREELAMKASSLTRREEALQHEKTGLFLKKGGGRIGAAGAGLLLRMDKDEVQPEPLREAVPPARLQPLLQAPVTEPANKPHHPQRFVFSSGK